jgi:hypothetical protein
VSLDQLNATIEGPDSTAWQAALLGWTVTGVPELQQFFATNGESNFGHYSDTGMDARTAAFTSLPGQSAAMSYAVAQQPWNFLPEGRHALLVADDVSGVDAFTSPQGFWSPEYLYLTGARACGAM